MKGTLKKIKDNLVGRVKTFFSKINNFFRNFLSKKTFIIASLGLILGLSISLLNVTLSYRELVEDKIEVVIPNEESSAKTGINYYNTSGIAESNSKEGAAVLLSDCLKEGLDTENLPSTISEKIDEINTFFQSNGNYFSFLYEDLHTGFVVSYNEDAAIFTASTIKAPAMIYLYEQASKGGVDLSEKLTYDGTFYSSGSGVLKNKEYGTTYTIKTLIEYAIIESDNIAYAMLMNRYGRENILSFWQQLGTKKIFTADTIWGYTTAKDASIYMKELYRFYLENDDYGTELMNYFKSAAWKMISDKDGVFNTANKGGWSNDSFHDVAIVFEENPYVLVIMSNSGTSDYYTLFNRMSTLVGELHEEYWKYKVSVCEEINQY